MSSLPEAHRKALDATGRIVRGIDSRQLDESTPCEDFDVRGLLNHVVSGNLLGRAAGVGQDHRRSRRPLRR